MTDRTPESGHRTSDTVDAVEGVEAVGDPGAGAPTGHREAREASS